MLNPGLAWQGIKKHPVTTAVIFSIAVHTVALAVIVYQRADKPVENLQVMMLNLTEKSPERMVVPVPEPLLRESTPIKPVARVNREKQSQPSVSRMGMIGRTSTGGRAAPVQLAMLKVGMQADVSLKTTQTVLQFDDSVVSLTSQGYADDILAATNRPVEKNGVGLRGAGVGGAIFGPSIGMGDCK